MRLLTLLLRLCCISVASLSLSCCHAPVQVPVDISDSPLYLVKGDPNISATFGTYAVEMHFLTAGKTDLNKEQFDKVTSGLVAMPLDNWTKFDTEIAKLCSQTPCNFATLALLAKVHEVVTTLQSP